jgi:hypothetical protein
MISPTSTILELRYLARDLPGETRQQFRERSLNNSGAQEMLRYADFPLILSEVALQST